MSATPSKLHDCLAAAQSSIRAAKAGRMDPAAGGYTFFPADQIISVGTDAFTAHELVFAPLPVIKDAPPPLQFDEFQETLWLTRRYRLTHWPSGAFEVHEIQLPVVVGDKKSDNILKAALATETIAHRELVKRILLLKAVLATETIAHRELVKRILQIAEEPRRDNATRPAPRDADRPDQYMPKLREKMRLIDLSDDSTVDEWRELGMTPGELGLVERLKSGETLNVGHIKTLLFGLGRCESRLNKAKAEANGYAPGPRPGSNYAGD